MKISKKPISVKAATAEKASSIQSASKEEAISHIYAAINCLGKEAKTDIVAKESIANLSVVLLDLK